jgi:hypothetical protein
LTPTGFNFRNYFDQIIEKALGKTRGLVVSYTTLYQLCPFQAAGCDLTKHTTCEFRSRGHGDSELTRTLQDVFNSALVPATETLTNANAVQRRIPGCRWLKTCKKKIHYTYHLMSMTDPVAKAAAQDSARRGGQRVFPYAFEMVNGKPRVHVIPISDDDDEGDDYV